MDAEELRQRTKQFGIRVVKLIEALPASKPANVIGNQLLRCGTSVGANYRAACRARSKRDFISKAGIAIEEADESLYWMELLIDVGLMPGEKLAALMRVANEIVAILTASTKTARASLRRQAES